VIAALLLDMQTASAWAQGVMRCSPTVLDSLSCTNALPTTCDTLRTYQAQPPCWSKLCGTTIEAAHENAVTKTPDNFLSR
jgi:hypothetical protein